MFEGNSFFLMSVTLAITIPLFSCKKNEAGNYAKINGIKIYYELKGKGDALVFIHSGGFDRRIWDDQFEPLSRNYKVLRYDVRGYGKSADVTKPYSETEDLFQLLGHCRIEKAHLIGVSLGAKIAIDFTLLHPELVSGLVAVAPGLNGYPYSPADTLEIMKIVYSIKNEDGTPADKAWLNSPYNIAAMENPLIARRIELIARENSRSWLINPFFTKIPFPPAYTRLKDIRIPTLIIIGDRDVPSVKSIAQTIGSQIPGAKTIILKSVGHIPNMEKPEEFNEALLIFLKENSN